MWSHASPITQQKLKWHIFSCSCTCQIRDEHCAFTVHPMFTHLSSLWVEDNQFFPHVLSTCQNHPQVIPHAYGTYIILELSHYVYIYDICWQLKECVLKDKTNFLKIHGDHDKWFDHLVTIIQIPFKTLWSCNMYNECMSQLMQMWIVLL